MGDLEDAFLKKNVPGRYSSWTEDNDDKKNTDADEENIGNDNFSDSEDDEYYFRGLPSTPHDSQQPPSAAAASQQQQQQRTSGNTGVKGVLADYREAKQQEQLRREEERLENLQILHRATHPAVRSDHISNSKNDNHNKNFESGDDVDLDDSDDDFLKQFRNQRLAQLQSQSTRSSTLPTFGSLASSSPEEYVQLVDEIDPRVFLVVHLNEPTIQQCNRLHSALERVAQCMNYAKFIEVRALEANPNLDTICLPTILIYKRGELVHNLVRFTDELPSRGFGVEDVRELLEGLGMVNTMCALNDE